MKTDATPEVVYSMLYKWTLEKGIKSLRRSWGSGEYSFREKATKLHEDLWSIKFDMDERGLSRDLLYTIEMSRLEGQFLRLEVEDEMKVWRSGFRQISHGLSREDY